MILLHIVCSLCSRYTEHLVQTTIRLMRLQGFYVVDPILPFISWSCCVSLLDAARPVFLALHISWLTSLIKQLIVDYRARSSRIVSINEIQLRDNLTSSGPSLWLIRPSLLASTSFVLCCILINDENALLAIEFSIARTKQHKFEFQTQIETHLNIRVKSMEKYPS